MNDNGGGAFPVLGFRMYRDKPLTVPWDFLAPHEAQAQRNHSQTLKRLAERGGLCPTEMLDILKGQGWATSLRVHGLTPEMAWGQVERELTHWLAEKARREGGKHE
jgi:hypothetical protein